MEEEEKEKVEKSNLNSTNNFRNHKTTISNRNGEKDFIYDIDKQKMKKYNTANKNLNKSKFKFLNFYDKKDYKQKIIKIMMKTTCMIMKLTILLICQ